MIHLKAFIVGSSFFVTLLPFLYLSIAKSANPTSPFEFLFVPITLPIIFSIVNMIVVYLSDKVLVDQPTSRYWLYGAVYGLALSLYGNFGKDIPVGLFGLPDTPVQYLVIPVAIILYASVFRYILKNLNQLFNLI